MNYLLDTHTFLWFLTDDPQLSRKGKSVIDDPETNKYVSIASFWEIAIKLSKGKLELTQPFSTLMAQMELNGFELLSISFEHTLELSTLPHHHGDPFDRIIISQAITEKYIAISRDKNFDKYNGLQLLW